jgi:hypothetical protein
MLTRLIALRAFTLLLLPQPRFWAAGCVRKTRRLLRRSRLIIEVTPRVRAMAAAKGQDWSTEALLGLKGHRVRITGWLLFDFEHVDESENTAPRKRENWRATSWEIHPVTDIKVIP